MTTTEITNMITTIVKGNGPYTQLISNSDVTGSVASETTRNSFFAVLAASFFILLYVWFSFRKVSKPWRYGTCAIIALLHDVLVVVGVFSILGWALHIQIDSLFITALLTVVGFSVHDTIVVFDRIRENMQRRTSESFEQVVDASLIQTLARSLNTSLTVLFTLSALTLFSNAGSVRNFTLALLSGMLLVMWEKGELFFKFFNKDPQQPVNGKRSTRERELSGTRG
jgi:preprotein translocase SecF subunit